MKSQGAGDAHPAGLATRELVRILVGLLGRQAHHLQQFVDLGPCCRPGRRGCETVRAAWRRPSSAGSGWRKDPGRSSASGPAGDASLPGQIWVMSWPSMTISPPVASTRRRIVRPSVVLPDPDSPTRPRVSPRGSGRPRHRRPARRRLSVPGSGPAGRCDPESGCAAPVISTSTSPRCRTSSAWRRCRPLGWRGFRDDVTAVSDPIGAVGMAQHAVIARLASTLAPTVVGRSRCARSQRGANLQPAGRSMQARYPAADGA